MPASTEFSRLDLIPTEKLNALMDMDTDKVDGLVAKDEELLALANKEENLLELASETEALTSLAAKAAELLALLPDDEE